jgi:hypothetical protein
MVDDCILDGAGEAHFMNRWSDDKDLRSFNYAANHSITLSIGCLFDNTYDFVECWIATHSLYCACCMSAHHYYYHWLKDFGLGPGPLLNAAHQNNNPLRRILLMLVAFSWKYFEYLDFC